MDEFWSTRSRVRTVHAGLWARRRLEDVWRLIVGGRLELRAVRADPAAKLRWEVALWRLWPREGLDDAEERAIVAVRWYGRPRQPWAADEGDGIVQAARRRREAHPMLIRRVELDSSRWKPEPGEF